MRAAPSHHLTQHAPPRKFGGNPHNASRTGGAVLLARRIIFAMPTARRERLAPLNGAAQSTFLKKGITH